MSDVAQLLESRRSRFGRWTAAALVVCALHVGGAGLALLYWEEVEDADDPAGGAPAVEMALLPAAAPVDTPDVAHGAEQQQAKLTTEAAKPVVEDVAKDVPPLDPSPARDAEVVLPKWQPEEKEKPPEQEEPRKTTPQERTPQQDEDIPITTAPQRVEGQKVAKAAPPSPVQSASVARAQHRWMNGLYSRLERFKRYPGAASRRGIKGVSIVRFTVDRTGQLIASEVLQSSGSPILDEEALATIRRASPFPLPPGAIADEYLANDVPIWFGMKPNQ
jgi:periplasmic protein TonB